MYFAVGESTSDFLEIYAGLNFGLVLSATEMAGFPHDSVCCVRELKTRAPMVFQSDLIVCSVFILLIRVPTSKASCPLGGIHRHPRSIFLVYHSFQTRNTNA